MRPSKLQMMLDIAYVVARRSTCSRLQVGCVLTNLDYQLAGQRWDPFTSHTRILAMGYNGSVAGGKNECDSDEAGQCGCLHAEMNALIKAPPGPKALFVTTSPCLTCAKLMCNADVREVYYGSLYRIADGLDLLAARHVHAVALGAHV